MRLLILSLVFLWSCSGDAVPKDVFPPKKMEAVLYDVIRADEFVDFSVLQDSTYRIFSKRTALYDSVFHMHNITKEGFRKSFQFYQSRPDLLRTILDSLYKRTDMTDTASASKIAKPA